jgi:hypothetical protein
MVMLLLMMMMMMLRLQRLWHSYRASWARAARAFDRRLARVLRDAVLPPPQVHVAVLSDAAAMKVTWRRGVVLEAERRRGGEAER